MKFSMQMISTSAAFVSLSMAAPYLDTRATASTSEATLPQPPAAPHTITDGRAQNRFLRVTNYTSPAISSYALMPCMLALGQTSIAHVDNGLPLTSPIPVPHGFQCTNNTVNLLVTEAPRMTYDELYKLTYLLLDWQQSYAFLGISFEYGTGSNDVITTGSVSTQKTNDSG